MQINTKAQAKTVVSALRREIKALGKGPEQLSHTDCLNLTAKALGFASWNSWEASLQDVVAETPVVGATVSKYPLVNNGDFDFVTSGEHGMPFSGLLVQLEGTSEVVFGRAGVNSVWRTKEQNLGSEYEGSTKVDWDSQRTRKFTSGAEIWEDEDGTEYSAARVVIAPENCDDPNEDEELPVRHKLIRAFIDYFAEERFDASSLNGEFDSVAEILGFALTIKEAEELRSKVEASASRT